MKQPDRILKPLQGLGVGRQPQQFMDPVIPFLQLRLPPAAEEVPDFCKTGRDDRKQAAERHGQQDQCDGWNIQEKFGRETEGRVTGIKIGQPSHAGGQKDKTQT